MKLKSFLLAGLLLTAVAAAATLNFIRDDSSTYHSVEMSVSRMTCGSCVESIRSAVTDLGAVGAVETDVAAARSRVQFDADKLDADTIAQTITRAGYPATILSVHDNSGRQIEGLDLEQFVARVGARLVKRADYDAVFAARQQEAEASARPATVSEIGQQAWYQLLKDELLLNAAEQFDATVDKQVLAQMVAAGSDTASARRALLIDAYLLTQTQGKQMNSLELNRLLNKLYNTTVVDIFDDNLKRILTPAKGGGGCGGGCCG